MLNVSTRTVATATKVRSEGTPELVHAVERLAFEKGLLVLSCGASTLRIAPPLVIDADDVKIGLKVLEDAIREARD